MASITWSPEKMGVLRQQNSVLWNDIELAYQFVENYARYSISGDLRGFLFELIRQRWNLACDDNYYETPPDYSQTYQHTSLADAFHREPTGLNIGSIDQLSLGKYFSDRFKTFASELKLQETDDKSGSVNHTAGKLYGYGTDGYGMYVPLHLLWPDLRNYWGIYISEAAVLNLAAHLYNRQPLRQMTLQQNKDGESENIRRIIQIAYQVILRHQLFHFKIEQWALLFELATGRAYYLPYLQNVYLPSIYNLADNNLEEALANLSILLSKKILKVEKELEWPIIKIIEAEFLAHQGPGYRNYYLEKGVLDSFDRTDRRIRYRQVVNYFCNQIIQHDLNPQEPLVPYYLYPPNNNFLRAEELCPIYVVCNLPKDISVMA